MPGPAEGFSCLEDLNLVCCGEAASCLPQGWFSGTESCLVGIAKFEKSDQCFKTCEISDRDLDFQFLLKLLQILPHSQGRIPGGRGPSHQPQSLWVPLCLRSLPFPVEMCKPGGTRPDMNLGRNVLPHALKNGCKMTRNSSPGH